MVANMKDNGGLIRQMEKEFSTTLMEIFTRVDGLMTRQMDKEFILIQMVQNM